MIETIYILLSVVSFFIIIFVFWRKISFLVEIEKSSNNNYSFFLLAKNKIKSLFLFKISFWQKALLKILSKLRIFILKIENKIGNYLNNLRKRSSK